MNNKSRQWRWPVIVCAYLGFVVTLSYSRPFKRGIGCRVLNERSNKRTTRNQLPQWLIIFNLWRVPFVVWVWFVSRTESNCEINSSEKRRPYRVDVKFILFSLCRNDAIHFQVLNYPSTMGNLRMYPQYILDILIIWIVQTRAYYSAPFLNPHLAI